MGIAEQNLVGIAAGLAHEGYRPYASTYASFACTRALDQVKVNLAYMQLPVRLIGLSAGLAAGILGPTHICTEDLAILRSLPNLVIVSPADGMEIVKALEASLQLEVPFYLRLTGGMELPPVYQEEYDFVIGKAIELRSGEDIAVISQGSMVSAALKMAEQLERVAYGVRCSICIRSSRWMRRRWRRFAAIPWSLRSRSTAFMADLAALFQSSLHADRMRRASCGLAFGISIRMPRATRRFLKNAA